ncbi:MAG: hypothetical protein FVQ80_08210 [Planctomycetes bacterium]|nr:hypothetical protein [Planctomycetota bacterium]
MVAVTKKPSKYITISAITIVLALYCFTLIVIAFDKYKHYVDELREEVEELIALKDLQIDIVKMLMPANDYLITGADDNEAKNLEILSRHTHGRIEQMKGLDLDLAEEKKYYLKIKDDFKKMQELSMLIVSSPELKGHSKGGAMMEELDSIADDILVSTEKLQDAMESELSWLEMGFFESRNNLIESVFLAASITIFFLLAVIVYLVREDHQGSTIITTRTDSAQKNNDQYQHIHVEHSYTPETHHQQTQDKQKHDKIIVEK